MLSKIFKSRKNNKLKKNRKNSLKQKVTIYDGKPRCCYLLNNGNRCAKSPLGKKNNRYVVHCKNHDTKCSNKYKYYKKYCNKIYKLSDRSKLKKNEFCKGVSKKGSKNRDKLLAKCINERFNYSRNCTAGCLVDPYDLDALRIHNRDDLKHRHEILMLIKNRFGCRKNFT